MEPVLDSLKPTGKWMIIDCVQSAGIDVRAWSFRKKGGQPVALPQSNGGYCYEWSFRSESSDVLLLCVWFEEMEVDSRGRICFVGNLRGYADTLIRQLEKDIRNRNRTIKDPRITRAQHFSSTVELAYVNEKNVRVVIVSGPVREKEEGEAGHDRAVGRELDDQAWFVESFDSATGAFVLVRGVRDQPNIICRNTGAEEILDGADISADGRVVDQFLVEVRVDSYVYGGVKRLRDPSVRRRVLARSGGICELTKVAGFKMANGGVYLETHHIIPLSEGGPDTVDNVIAITADAHRQLHYGVQRDELKARCLEIVANWSSR
ncbi:HNH endonuclease [Pseudomonas sp. 22105]|uniref:HNH endonuclease n=1 Tax=unclassified Pseudomonas TaxID=196821 RepID=UPI000D2562DB|nr:hypothetical protein DBV33_09705 [Pseudomonas fluorescens]